MDAKGLIESWYLEKMSERLEEWEKLRSVLLYDFRGREMRIGGGCETIKHVWLCDELEEK